MSSIEQKIKLYKKFKNIFERPSLKKDLQTQYEQIVESQRENVLMDIKATVLNSNMTNQQIRNMPHQAKQILWLNHLNRRADEPIKMLKFENNPVVGLYNDVIEILVKKQIQVIMEFFTTVENHKSKLQSPVFTSVTRQNGEKLIVVNFDPVVFQLIRESKVLERKHIKLLKPAETVLIQEDKYKRQFNELNEVIGEYYKVRSKIRSILTKLMQPHLKAFEYKLKPGFYEITWTSLKIESFIKQIKEDLIELSELIYNSNDLIESRIEKNIKAISQEVLVTFPETEGKAIQLEDFVQMQRSKIEVKTTDLKSKNVMIEKAVNDLLQMIDADSGEKEKESQRTVKEYYNQATYQALLHSTKASLNKMKDRVCNNAKNGQKSHPFFEIHLQMNEKKELILKPSIESVQGAINNAAKEVLSCSKKIYNWGQDDKKESEKEPFYKQIATDKEIVRVILLLTGSVKGTEEELDICKKTFTEFERYYKKEPEDYVSDFVSKFKDNRPILAAYSSQMHELDKLQTEIEGKPQSFPIGAISLKNEFIKESIDNALMTIKRKLCQNLHDQAKSDLENITEKIKTMSMSIDRPHDNIEDLVGIMEEIAKVRDQEYEMRLELAPVREMQGLIDVYKQSLEIEQNAAESSKRSELDDNWKKLLNFSNSKYDEIRSTESTINDKLVNNITNLKERISKFIHDYETKGPKEEGLGPKEAADRLSTFKGEYQLLDGNRRQYNDAQGLLGIPKEPFSELTKMQLEINTLEKLYNLFNQVCVETEVWDTYTFTELQKEQEMINAMRDNVLKFTGEGKKLGKDLKKYAAYTEMETTLGDYNNLIELVEGMVNENTNFNELHWKEINDNIAPKDAPIPYEDGVENIKFKMLHSAKLHAFKEEVFEIIDRAKNQKKALEKLDKIRNLWDKDYIFNFRPQKDKNIQIFGSTAEITDNLTNDQNEVGGLQSKKFMAPFMDQIKVLNDMFTNLESTIKKWNKVQSLWSALEPVFSAEDIRKSLPQEAAKFKNIDKDFVKNMNLAKDIKNIKQCCENDVIVSRLPDLEKQLYECQRKLNTYLEKKKQTFARFYFVSDETLLSILSTGSNPELIKEQLINIFDGLTGIVFNEGVASVFYSNMGKVKENIKMTQELHPMENIEEWLCELERIMMDSVKRECERTNVMVIADNKFEDDINEYLTLPAQCALMGMQFYWTFRSEELIFNRARQPKEKKAEVAEFKQLEGVMNKAKDTLIQMCLTDLDRLQRQKVEAVITIYVHLMEIFRDIVKVTKKLEEFNWQKQNRLYWLEDYDNCIISITDVDFKYSYEQLGAKERLGVTGLTDKCQITLAQALGMQFGGAPAGPAGTGKTETTKDMGRTLGIYVVVTNCTPEQCYDDAAGIFKGLSIAGIWGCFDEFNRIKLEVLSVIATQVQYIKAAKIAQVKTMIFPDRNMSEIKFNPTVGQFITMNPGYAGRQELPENLKVQFRGVCMMVPDRREIMKTFLATSG